jgi:hypothetical protein
MKERNGIDLPEIPPLEDVADLKSASKSYANLRTHVGLLYMLIKDYMQRGGINNAISHRFIQLEEAIGQAINNLQNSETRNIDRLRVSEANFSQVDKRLMLLADRVEALEAKIAILLIAISDQK